jgi:hypothetical protein
MKFLSKLPQNWQELEDKVEDILNKSGFKAEKNKLIKLVRGEVKIDVFAEKNNSTPPIKILCECKYWETNIPQTIIHSFRTVVSDCGANLGYIIAKTGFQSGAVKASELTNIQLITWEQFQDIFREDYLRCFIYPELQKHVDALVSFTEPISPGNFLARGKLKEENIQEFIELQNQYSDFAFFCLFHWQQTFIEIEGFKILKLPIEQFENKDKPINMPDTIKKADNYEDFLNEAKAFATEGIRKFRNLIIKS